MQTIQQQIQQWCSDSEGTVSFRASYSGRGMYCAECIGIVGSLSDCQQCISDIIMASHDEVVSSAYDGAEGDEEAHCELDNMFNTTVQVLLQFKLDSMGNEVILYWPALGRI